MSTDTDNILARMEREEKTAKAQVGLAKVLERLQENRDFIKLITEGYFEQEAIRLVRAKANNEMQTPEKQAAIMKDIDGIGALYQYFDTVRALGQIANRHLENIEAQRTEIFAGDME